MSAFTIKLLYLTLLFFTLLPGVYGKEAVPDTTRADRYLKRADSLKKHGHYDSAVYYYNRATALYKTHNKWKKYIRAHNGWGYTLRRAGKFDEALNTLHKALATGKKQRLEQSPEMAASYSDLGMVYENLGQYDQALDCHKTALDIFLATASEYYSGVSASYHNLALTYQNLGQYEQALDYYQRSLKVKIDRSGEENLNVSYTYNNIANIYHILGRFDEALINHQKSLKIKIKLVGEDHIDAAFSYNNMGFVYQDLGQYDLALHYYRKSLKIKIAYFGHNHPLAASTYENLGAFYDKSNDREKALDYYRKTLSIRADLLGNHHPEVAETYATFGAIYKKSGLYQQALTHYQKALHSNDSTTSPDDITRHPSLENHLDAHRLLTALGGKAKVLTQFAQAITSVADPPGLALETYRVADTLIRQMYRHIPYEKDKLTLAATASELYAQAARNALLLYDRDEEADYRNLAFYFSEQNKAAVLSGALADHRAKQFAGLPDSLLVLEKALKSERAFHIDRLTNTKDRATQRTHQDRLFRVNRQLDSLIASLEAGYPRYYELKYARNTADIPALQASLSPSDALIEYLKPDSVLYAFVITQNKVSLVETPLPADYDSLITAFSRSAGDTDYPEQNPEEAANTYLATAKKLYDLLMKAPLAMLPEAVSRLIIVPEGRLARLNFELLLPSLPSGAETVNFRTLDYLLRRYAFSYAPSATLWKYQQQAASEAVDFPQPYGGYAPDYTGWEIPDSLSNKLLARRVRAGHMALPHAREEVQQIARLLNGKTWTGVAATEQNFRKYAADYQVLHLAMHTLIDDKEPLRSQFVFAPGKDSVNDGALTAAELYTMHLPARLAVLSACETGYGNVKKGEGIMSLSRAFLYAGCPSLIAALWKAPDRQAKELMVRFFSHLKEGKNKAESLRQAKLAYLESADEITAHPFYWAGFVPIGNTSPIPLKKGYFLWIALALAAVALSVTVLIIRKSVVRTSPD